MSFQLNSVVPWGRNFGEYQAMFALGEKELSGKTADFGGGPSSFNREATERGYSVTSFDPIYGYTKEETAARIEETRGVVMRQMRENSENYVWKNFRSLEELENARMSAMRLFLEDFERGKTERRYIQYELPSELPFGEDSFDLGLSSHFLLMYTDLGLDFHLKAIKEMLRVCREVRIFPIVDLDARVTDLTDSVINSLEQFYPQYSVNIIKTDYEFQKGGNKMLCITK